MAFIMVLSHARQNVSRAGRQTSDHYEKNSLFAGSDAGARRWAIANTPLTQSCKLNDVEPLAYLTDVLQRIVSGRTKSRDLNALLP